MACSVERRNMQLELRKTVAAKLRALGFKGSFPHLRRFRDGKAELISFLAHSNEGGGFNVGASIIFTEEADPARTNLFYPNDPPAPERLIWADGRICNGLQGMFPDDLRGAFYYVDVYAQRTTFINAQTGQENKLTMYIAVTPAYAKYFTRHSDYELVLKADETIYARAAEAVNAQIPELLRWFDSIVDYDDLKAWERATYG